MTNIGTITKVTSQPRGFVLTTPAQPGPPPVPSEEIPYLCTADDLVIVSAARSSGATVKIEGTPPACEGVTY